MSFIQEQLLQIRNGGWPMLWAKTQTTVWFILAAPLCLPGVLLIRMARPWKVIRFTWLPSRLIGHAVFDPEMYLSRKALGLSQDKRFVDLYFFESRQHSNLYWKRIVERHLPVARFYYYLHRYNKMFPGWTLHWRTSYGELHASADPENILARVDPQITFTAAEHRLGEAFLRKIGLPVQGKYVCVQVRDDAHDAKLNPVGLPSGYNTFRNADVNDYIHALNFLTEKGYWVIRMGKLTTHAVATGNPLIFDYSNSGERNEFLDLWLSFNCTLMITTGSGIDALAAIGRKPLVMTNFLAYLDVSYMYRNSITIFKHLFDATSGRKLGLQEIVGRESETYFKSSDFYQSRGIEWKSNSSEELKDVVEEMHCRLNGTWEETMEDMALQRQAAKIFATSAQYRSQYTDGYSPRLGRNFLGAFKLGIDNDLP